MDDCGESESIFCGLVEREVVQRVVPCFSITEVQVTVSDELI